MTDAPDPASTENHRTRVGREKRERMRRRLLDSVVAVCSGLTASGPAVIDDVIRHAGVSRGTFYKYFESLEQAIAEVAFELVDEMVDTVSPYYTTIADPAFRTATGFQAYLSRAIMDHQWGGFVTHLGLLSGDNVRVLANIKADIRLGVETGDYAVASVGVAADLLVGAKIEAIRRIIAEDLGADYMQAMTELVLRAFGITPTKAAKVVRQAYAHLCKIGPDTIPWWKPLDPG